MNEPDKTPPGTTKLAAMHDLVESHLEPRTVLVQKGAVLVTSAHYKVTDLEDIVEKHGAHPIRAKGISSHHTLASIIEHAKKFATADTATFCALVSSEPAIRVIYNYTPTPDAARGGWRDHGATYAFPMSDAWKRWTGVAGQWLSLTQFAELIEAGIGDVRDSLGTPDAPRLPGVTYATPTDLLTLAQGLSVRVEQHVTEQKRLDNGTGTLLFSEEHETSAKGGAPLRVPNGFLLAIPVFVGGDPYAVPVRLRYRVQSRQVVWQVALHDAEAARRDAITEAAENFAAETNLPVFFGTPEQ